MPLTREEILRDYEEVDEDIRSNCCGCDIMIINKRNCYRANIKPFCSNGKIFKRKKEKVMSVKVIRVVTPPVFEPIVLEITINDLASAQEITGNLYGVIDVTKGLTSATIDLLRGISDQIKESGVS